MSCQESDSALTRWESSNTDTGEPPAEDRLDADTFLQTLDGSTLQEHHQSDDVFHQDADLLNVPYDTSDTNHLLPHSKLSDMATRLDGHSLLSPATSNSENGLEFPAIVVEQSSHKLPEAIQTMMPALARTFNGGPNDGSMTGLWTPSSMRDFGLESNYDFNDLDLDFLDTYNRRVPFNCTTLTERTFPMDLRTDHSGETHSGLAIGAEAFQRSVWHFIPATEDFGMSEQHNLSLPLETHETPDSGISTGLRISADKLPHSSRDRILVIIWSAWRKSSMTQLSAAFPSVDLLDNLLHYFLSSSVSRASDWFHLPTVLPSKIRSPELLIGLIAAGAVLTPDTTINKIGFALQEALRNYLPTLVRRSCCAVKLVP